MLVLFRNYHPLTLKRAVSPVKTLLLSSKPEKMLPDEKKPSKFLSTCLGLWGLPDDVLNYTVEAFASHLPKLWTEGLN